jgi:hypothetical protein
VHVLFLYPVFPVLVKREGRLEVCSLFEHTFTDE